ncbi:MAG: protein kinase [Chloroflexi bacterium]|nr:protein kinase [Chloroflexota bacterium]
MSNYGVDNLVGQRIGQYEIRDLLGKGGMGAVYRAYQPTLQRHVAIKVLQPSLADDPTFFERFSREAQTAALLEHPNIIPIYDYGSQENRTYVVMRLLNGGSLAEQLRRSLMSPAQAARIISEIANALYAAHSQGIVHRDIKPSNIMFDELGHAYLGDFGIAHILTSSTSLTGSGVMIGTPAFMSPEQWRGEAVSPASDQYSLAVMAYEMLAGRPMFEADTPFGLLQKHVYEPPPRIQTARPDLPDVVQSILERALAKDPVNRFPNVLEFARALEIAIGGAGEAGSVFSTLPPRAIPLDQATMAEAPSPRAGGDRYGPPPTPPPTSPPSGFGTAYPVPAAPAAKRPPSRAQGAFPWRPTLVIIVVLTLALLAVQAMAVLLSSEQGRLTLGIPALAVLLIAGALLAWRELSRRERPPAAVKEKPAVKPAVTIPEPKPEPPVSEAVLPTAPEIPVLTPPPAPDMMRSALIELDSLREGGFLTEDVQIRKSLGIQLTVMQSGQSALIGRTVKIIHTPFMIGRQTADLNLDDDLTVSRQHARIEKVGDEYQITDLSSGGTEVDGRQLRPNEPVKLYFDSIIKVGTTTFKFVSETPLTVPNLEGQEINERYQVGKRLNRTGKSAIYQAYDRTMNREVALKVLSPDLATYPGYIEQFTREAQTAANLRHPNIVSVYEYGTIENTSYIVMQLLSGDSITKRLAAPLSLSESADIVVKLAGALHYAHSRDVVHSGLKPSAIVFDDAGEPYITDFAIAQTAGKSVNVVGAPAFMAPEQWRSEAATPRTDQYALATLAYLMVTGETPFSGADPSEFREKHLNRSVPSAHRVAADNGRADVPEAVSDVLRKALAKNPDERYTTVNEFAQAFAAALQPARKRAQPQVFISYRRAPSAMLATLLAVKLNSAGIEAYVDTRKQDGGGPFPTRLLHAIEDSDVFVCLLADNTFESDWVQREVEHAHQLNKPMIPVFQESYVAPTDITAPHIASLLQHDGVHILDIRNLYVDQAIADLAQMVKATVQSR